MLCQQLSPLCWRHFDVFLRFRLGMLEFLWLILLFYDLFLDLILMLAKRTNSLFMQFLFLGIGSH